MHHCLLTIGPNCCQWGGGAGFKSSGPADAPLGILKVYY